MAYSSLYQSSDPRGPQQKEKISCRTSPKRRKRPRTLGKKTAEQATVILAVLYLIFVMACPYIFSFSLLVGIISMAIWVELEMVSGLERTERPL